MSINHQPSTINPVTILRARAVLPICRPAIENGAVAFSGDLILAVGRWKDVQKKFSGAVFDLEETVLLPGLINAHCHLDYTDMAGLFPPRKSFCDWIKLITTEKSHWSFSDYAESWINGAKQLLHSGTTTVADIEAVPELLPDVWDATPLRVLSLLEMTGVKSRRKPELILRDALDVLDELQHSRSSGGISPHAPYSTTPALLRHAAVVARKRKLLVATHVAESATEFEMFTNSSGELHHWLENNNRDMSDCGGVSPVQLLSRHNALGPHLMAIHVNHLKRGDARMLAQKRTSVVHCPRSHDFFSHAEFPFATLQRAGVNICLGTDSLATVRMKPRQTIELNMFEEMRAFAAKHEGVSPETTLKMATINSARAIGQQGKLGELKRGAMADIIALPCSGDMGEQASAVIQHTGNVAASLIGGEWAIDPTEPRHATAR
jgi:cytosine/adenosine deaminase-related metal-dependent hydrolase